MLRRLKLDVIEIYGEAMDFVKSLLFLNTSVDAHVNANDAYNMFSSWFGAFQGRYATGETLLEAFSLTFTAGMADDYTPAVFSATYLNDCLAYWSMNPRINIKEDIAKATRPLSDAMISTVRLWPSLVPDDVSF